jgi:hypothetical protein
VDIIFRILTSELSSGSKLLAESVDVLSSLFQEKHVDIFKSTAKKVIKQLSYSSSSADSTSHQSQSLSQSLSQSSSSQSSSQVTRDLYPSSQQSSTDKDKNKSSSILNHSSNNNKRGHQMLSTIKQPSPASKPKPLKSLFSSLKDINIEKMEAKSNEVSYTQQEKVKKARLDCIVCASTPISPLINQCGHICCEQCWYVHHICISINFTLITSINVNTRICIHTHTLTHLLARQRTTLLLILIPFS